MEGKAFFILLVMCLGFSIALSSAQVPTSRWLNSVKDDPFVKDLLSQGEKDREVAFAEGRMDLESNDYTGTGANNRHDPKTPGRF